jgi:hypothetical protein
MKRVMLLLVSLVVAVALASPLLAGAPPEGKKGPKERPVPGVFHLPRHIEPTADQQAKLDALVAKYLPKVKELDEQMDSVFTAERKAARDAARKAAHEDGLRGKEANERVEAAVKLSDEQAAKRAAAKQAREKLDEEIRDQVMGMLTAEQKASKPEKKGPPEGKPKKHGPPHGKKGGPKDKDD